MGRSGLNSPVGRRRGLNGTRRKAVSPRSSVIRPGCLCRRQLLPSRSLWVITLATVLGAILYRLFIALALSADFIGLQAQDLNLVTAVLVGLALVLPTLKAKLRKTVKGNPA